MYRARRLTAIWSVLLLFQWILLGSGLICGTHARMSGQSVEGMAGEMAVQMSHRTVPASNVASVTAADDESSCNMAGSNTCQTTTLPGGACGAMSSCAPIAALSVRPEF